MATNAHDTIGGTFVNVAPNDKQTVDISTLGNPATQHYISVINQDPNRDGSWQVDIN